MWGRTRLRAVALWRASASAPICHARNVLLKVPELVDFFIAEIPYRIVGRHRLELEEFGEAVVGLGEARLDVELPFGLQDMLAEVGDVVAGQADSEPRVDHVDQGRQALGDVQGRESNEDAHPGRVDSRGRDLEVPGELDLAVLLERIDMAADVEDVGGDGVAGGVVGAHGAGSIRYADPLDRAGIVGRNPLVFYHRYPGDAEGLADRAGAAAENAAKRGPRADVVHEAVGKCDVVQVIDAAVGAQPPDGLVLEAGGHVLPFLVGVDLGALDDAAGVAAMLRFAAAGDDGVMHGFAGDLLMRLELAVGEVAGRQAAGLVEDVDQHVGPVGGQSFAADRVVEQGLGKGAGGGLEFLRFGDFHAGGALVVDGDELEFLGAHHRAETAATVAADLAVGVLDRDVGRGHFQFAGGADGQDAGFLPQAGFDGLDHRKVSLADQFLFFLDGDAVLGDVEA